MLSRLAVLAQLGLICLSANFLLPGTSRADRVASSAKKEIANAPSKVKGWGQTEAEARQDAANKGRELVTEYLRKHHPDMVWIPSAEYVRKNLLGDKAEHQEEVQEVALGPEKVKVESWVWDLKLSPTTYEAMLREDARVRTAQYQREREVRAQDRMLLLAKLLAVAVAGLLAVVGYLRLDEWTKGYYSRCLTIVGVSLLAGLVLALWLAPWTWLW